jgi:hypothetical protein
LRQPGPPTYALTKVHPDSLAEREGTVAPGPAFR